MSQLEGPLAAAAGNSRLSLGAAEEQQQGRGRGAVALLHPLLLSAAASGGLKANSLLFPS